MICRLYTNAKIVLERAGYEVTYTIDKNTPYLTVMLPPGMAAIHFHIVGGTVNNEDIVTVLAARGFDASGYPVI